MKKFNKRDLFILALIIGFYLFWELYAITIPTLHTDEARIAEISLSIIHRIKNQDKSIFRSIISNVTGNYYHGVGEAYLLIPFILAGGGIVFSIKIFSMFVGLVTLLLLYFFCLEFLNRGFAFIVVFLLVIDWTFIVKTNTGLAWGSVTDVFLIGSLLSFLTWYKKRNIFYFAIGCFLIGMGTCVKIWFFWYVIALGACSIIFIRTVRRKFSTSCLILGITIFCIGAFKLIYNEIKSHFGIVQYAIEHFTKTDNGGYNNLQYFKHLVIRAQNFMELPSVFLKPMLYGSSDKMLQILIERLPQFYFYLFLICLVWHCLTIVLKRGGPRRQKGFMLILFFAMFLQTPFTLSNLVPLHLLSFIPIVKILLGLAFYEMAMISKAVKILVVTLLVILFTVHSFGVLNYYSILEKKDEGTVSIKKVVDYLITYGLNKVVLMDYGMWHLIPIISEGKISEDCPLHGFSLTEDETIFRIKFNEQMAGVTENAENVYLFQAPEAAAIKCFNLFEQLAKEKGKQVKEKKRFYRRDGKLIFLLYEVS